MSSSNLTTRKVRLSDRELLQRVQRVAVPEGPIELRRLLSKRGWRRVRIGVTSGMEMHFRVSHSGSRQCEVIAGGDTGARASEVMALLQTPTESESNSLFRALYGSHFIYSSLLHTLPNMERGSVISSTSDNGAAIGQQLLVRTASFAHKGLANPLKQRMSTSMSVDSMTSWNMRQRQTSGAKNEQCCYIELYTPVGEGFKQSFCTLDVADVLAGKAPPERVIPLHSISGWLIVEPSPRNPETVRLTYHAAFNGNVPGGCDFRVAQSRLLFLAKGVCRLAKVLRRRRRLYQQQRTTPGRMWQALLNPFRVMGVVNSEDESSGGTHHNWHCIACTRSFFPTLRRSWQRCDLCAYRVCDEPPCCSRERVTIYNRYVAPLLVCARCRECIDEQEGDDRASGNLAGSSAGDVRYTGVSLRFANRESEFEPEFELDPSTCNHSRWGSSDNRRSNGGLRSKRRTQSDPPPMLDLVFSSSEEDSNS